MTDEDQETSMQPPITAVPAELKSTKLDFASTIPRLEQRAIGSRRRAKWAGYLLVLGVYGIIGTLSYNLVRNNSTFEKQFPELNSRMYRHNIEDPFTRRISYIMQLLIGPDDTLDVLSLTQNSAGLKFIPLNDIEREKLQNELKEALNDLEKAVKISDIRKKNDVARSEIAPIVSTVVFSLGTIGILILMIQISVMFIRYHLRLGELYDAQADALRASAGDAALAYVLLQHLSPNSIEVGKQPITLYEKAFDAIQAVANSKHSV